MLSSKLFLASALTLAAGLAASVPASADTFDFSLLDGIQTSYLCGRLTCHAFNWYQVTTEVFTYTGVQANPWTIGSSTLSFTHVNMGTSFGTTNQNPNPTLEANNSLLAGMQDTFTGPPMQFSSSTPFNLNSVYLGWGAAGTETVTGYNGSQQAYQTTLTLPGGALQGQTFTFDWANLTLVTFSGVFDAALTNIEVNDPFTVATPLPAALPLFATGLGALGLLGWRRKRKDKSCEGSAL